MRTGVDLQAFNLALEEAAREIDPEMWDEILFIAEKLANAMNRRRKGFGMAMGIELAFFYLMAVLDLEKERKLLGVPSSARLERVRIGDVERWMWVT